MFALSKVSDRDSTSVGRAINLLRIDQGLSVNDLCKMANMSPNTVEKVLKSDPTVRLSSVERVIQALNQYVEQKEGAGEEVMGVITTLNELSS